MPYLYIIIISFNHKRMLQNYTQGKKSIRTKEMAVIGSENLKSHNIKVALCNNVIKEAILILRKNTFLLLRF